MSQNHKSGTQSAKSSKDLQWKEKYLDALEVHEQQEEVMKEQLNWLRKGVSRLCLAAKGQDATLDDQLSNLRETVKESDMVISLPPLLGDLEKTIIDLDKKRFTAGKKIQQFCLQLIDLIDSLVSDKSHRSELKSLKRQVKKVDTDRGLEGFYPFFESLQEWVHRFQNPTRDDHAQEKDSGLKGLFSWLQKENQEVIAQEAQPSECEDLDLQDQEVSAEVVSEHPLASSLHQEDEVLALDDSVTELGEAIRLQLVRLLDELNISDDQNHRKEYFVEHRLIQGLALEDIPIILEEMIDLIFDSLSYTRHEFEHFLYTLNHRLEELHEVISDTQLSKDGLTHLGQELGESMKSMVSDMRVHFGGAQELEGLKQQVDRRLTQLLENFDSFREKEKQQQKHLEERVNWLSSRVSVMEKEALKARKRLEEQRIKSLHDTLTELPNREAYQEKFRQEYARWQRYGTPISLLVLDIDHFKSVNDQYGHLAGDKVLFVVAKELRKQVRRTDMVARYGGEEFVVVMPETNQQAARFAAEKLRESIADCKFRFKNQPVPITVSIGVSELTGSDTMETVYERADQALYQAKHHGRNRVETG